MLIDFAAFQEGKGRNGDENAQKPFIASGKFRLGAGAALGRALARNPAVAGR